jgi:sugar lactone lactonase YvrE
MAADLEVLVAGRGLVESPRWHDGRIWFSDWIAGEIIAVDDEAKAEVMLRHQSLPLCFDFLPDGRLVLVSNQAMAVLTLDSAGDLSPYADLSALSAYGHNDIVVDGRGNAYVNSGNFDFATGPPDGEVQPGYVALVTPDGVASVVAEDIAFPNGMAVTPDNQTLLIAESFAGQLTAFDISDDGSLTNRRVWAGGIGPDSICLDAEGFVWTHSADTKLHTGREDAPAGEAIRVREGGEIVQRIPIDRPSFGCALGGPDRRTLFLVASEWRGVEEAEAVLAERTGQVLVTGAPAAGVGFP